MEESLQREPLRILVCEDAEDVRELFVELLGGDGRVVVGVGSGEDAIREIEANAFHIAFIDIGLPGMTGLDVATIARRRTPRPRLVAISGFSRPKDMEAARGAGFDLLLVKPIQKQQLLAAMGTVRR